MDEPTTALARRWRAARGFGWIEGMLARRYGRVREEVSIGMADADVRRQLVVDDPGSSFPSDDPGIPVPDDAIPDLDDPLTRMAALLMFRAAYADDGAYVMRDGDEWVAWAEIDGIPGVRDGVGMGPTEIEALIHALEAAPETP